MNIEFTNFSEWKLWVKREELDGLAYPGVYALAVTTKSLSGEPFSLIQEIEYFGMTNQNKDGLRGRLNQFENTVKGKTGHGGACRFRNHYRDQENLTNNLYVSINHVECDILTLRPSDLRRMGEIAKFEYLCNAEYLEKFNTLPKFHHKLKFPKK